MDAAGTDVSWGNFTVTSTIDVIVTTAFNGGIDTVCGRSVATAKHTPDSVGAVMNIDIGKYIVNGEVCLVTTTKHLVDGIQCT